MRHVSKPSKLPEHYNNQGSKSSRWLMPLTISLLILLDVCLLGQVAQAKYGGGGGTADDPYQIATAADLLLLGDSPEDYDKHFILTADIDLDPNLPGGKVFDKAVIGSFSGTFDGKGHRIVNMTIFSDRSLGLFGSLRQGAVVLDLGLVGVNVVGTGGSIGGLAGSNHYYGTVLNSYSTGSVSGDRSVGGLVGENRGTVSNSYSTSSVSGDRSVGGLVGSNYYYGTVSNSYSTSSVSGNRSVGGLLGMNDGIVLNSYSTGMVGGKGSSFYWEDIGGLVGDNWGNVSNSFWDTSTSGQTTSDGGTGLTTAQMQDPRTFNDTGWDFLGEIENGLHEIWQMPTGGGYPVLSVFNGYVPSEPNGEGSLEEPYLLETPQDLGTVWYRPTACYRLASDIDLSGIMWSTAVVPVFAGEFDGHGHRIMNLTISGGGYLGLFGSLVQDAMVLDLGLEDVNVVGAGNYVGGLVGYNDGTVLNNYSTGMVSGRGIPFYWAGIGGLVGYNDDAVLNSYSMVTVIGTCDYVGGLIGHNQGIVTQCHSSGSVGGTYSSIGGLVGYNHSGTISNSYSVSSVSGWGPQLEFERTVELQQPMQPGSTLIVATASGSIEVAGQETDQAYVVATIQARADTEEETQKLAEKVNIHFEQDGNNVSIKADHPELLLNQSISISYNIFVPQQTNVECESCCGSVKVMDLIGNVIIRAARGSAKNIQGSIHGQTCSGSVCEEDADGESHVGGLVGYNHGGTISYSYSTGTVKGSKYFGGLVGSNEGTASNSFWDTSTSEQSTSDGGTGKTTAEMQTISTFLDAGWDFVDETVNGTEDIWWILEGRDYPRLWWELTEEP